MTTTSELLIEGYERIGQVVHAAVDGLTEEQLTARIGPDANTIGWLIWHLTRVQDDHIADVAGIEQVWTTAGFVDEFALPFDAAAHGYGHSSEDVAAVKGIGADRLIAYYDAVYAQTSSYLAGLSDADLDRVVDTRWDPPVTLAARLISVLSDDLQHAGQAAYVKGLL